MYEFKINISGFELMKSYLNCIDEAVEGAYA